MNSLTATEVKVLNGVSQEVNSTVKLGDKVQALISLLPIVGTPTNAVVAGKSLAVTGVVIHGETVSFSNPALGHVHDVYEFLADDDQIASSPTNIEVDISSHVVKASVTLTMDTQPVSGDKVTLGTKIYTFVPVGTATADGEVSIGADLSEAQANLVFAISGGDNISTMHPLVSASNFTDDDCTITARIGGTAGNNLDATETFTAVTNVFSTPKFANGANCSAANAIVALVAAITALDTQHIGAVDGSGDTIDLTADSGGVAGNAITLATTMANGAFAGGATHLTGGVDGTIGSVNKLMIDPSYLYVCVAENTVSGTNWRRISVGSEY